MHTRRTLAFLFVTALAMTGCSSDGDPDPGPFVPNGLDVLFVIDNSRSMVGEQTALAQAFSTFTAVLDEKVGAGKWHMAVVTTGMESNGCGPCPPDNANFYSCTNETGETGRFQDRLGRNIGTVEAPEFDFIEDPSCKVISADRLECFYDPAEEAGVVFTGVNGCGYERGLAPIRAALSEPLLATWNGGFLREDARLAVVVISDEDDCGEVGDVTENIQGISGKVCYYAARGTGPDGSHADPQDGLPYQLTPVHEYHDFLVGLKGGHEDAVRFAAIVGVDDPADPAATRITFKSADATADVNPACSTPNCQSPSGYCDAYPGTRYIALAETFGLDSGGFVDTICQMDFSQTLTALATFLTDDWQPPTE